MSRTCPYLNDPSNLTDEQWAILEPLIPPLKPEATFYVQERLTIADAILPVLPSRCRLLCTSP
ncbi:hypothetical protein EPA93_44305 [Ktedonosporobacter rubrisoli]|uniref:Uncharacterized protein n=1 Tax=Ktedonosporobacter rubrisoli TaxID=2509675 RepID=A0A4P6K371_KTERU|nr:transposase [Ktedonosporobacter rubrisoli]QBD82619.1 hypothetical protein EPA93_44305 [Ktedonosporobacter rubrisoli]